MEKRVKPNWKDAPEWAHWWAVNGDGEAIWYECKPMLSLKRGGWTAHWRGDACWAHSYDVKYIYGWTKSLMERPKEVCDGR